MRDFRRTLDLLSSGAFRLRTERKESDRGRGVNVPLADRGSGALSLHAKIIQNFEYNSCATLRIGSPS